MRKGFIVSLLTLLLALPVFLQQPPSPRTLWESGQFEMPPLPATPATKAIFPGSLRASPRLRSLISQSNTKSITDSSQDARQQGLIVENQMLALRFLAKGPEEAAGLKRRIEELGGDVVGNLGNMLLGSIPVSKLLAISESPDLEYLAPQDESQNHTRTSEGVGIANVARLHSAGLTGKGVKVGIIDFGFEGYERLRRAGALPASKAVFDGGHKLENGEVHGTGCAEIIHSMAPDADLYLALTNGREDQFLKAALWLAEQGVDIINYSGGTAAESTDGRGFGSTVVSETTKKWNILWVVSSGNYGDSHWSGPLLDKDSDGWVDIGEPGKRLWFMTPGNTTLRVTVRWDDWGADPIHPKATEDIDAYLYEVTADKKLNQVGKSEIRQDGDGEPLETIKLDHAKQGTIYALGLKMVRVKHPVTVHLFAKDAGEVFPMVAAGSIMSPASGPLSLATGAVRIADGKLASYSSQGPTDDGRMKPDVAAPTEVTSESYPEKGGFSGTSASAPHVTGFAALLKQQNPRISAQDLFHRVTAAVKPTGTPVPNQQFGFGVIDGSVIALGPSRGGTPPPPSYVPPVNPAISTSTIELPASWGGVVPVSALDHLIESPRPSGEGLKASIVVGRERYKLGDGMKIGYRVNRDSHYLLLHRSSSGGYTLVAPHVFAPSVMAANESYLLPGAGMSISVVPPVGREQFLLLAAPKPLNLLAAPAGTSLAIAVAQYEVVSR